MPLTLRDIAATFSWYWFEFAGPHAGARAQDPSLIEDHLMFAGVLLAGRNWTDAMYGFAGAPYEGRVRWSRLGLVPGEDPDAKHRGRMFSRAEAMELRATLNVDWPAQPDPAALHFDAERIRVAALEVGRRVLLGDPVVLWRLYFGEGPRTRTMVLPGDAPAQAAELARAEALNVGGSLGYKMVEAAATTVREVGYESLADSTDWW